MDTAKTKKKCTKHAHERDDMTPKVLNMLEKDDDDDDDNDDDDEVILTLASIGK